MSDLITEKEAERDFLALARGENVPDEDKTAAFWIWMAAKGTPNPKVDHVTR